jgi:uncharacterized protein YecE (DUF72 family)
MSTVVSTEKIARAFEIVKRVQVPLLQSIDALPAGASIAQQMDWKERALHACKATDEWFRDMTARDWDELVDAGLLERVVEPERRNPDPWGSKPYESVDVVYLLLTDAGRSGYVTSEEGLDELAKREAEWQRRREEVAAHAPITPFSYQEG